MLDHIGLRVTDYPKSKAFYEQALAPLGYGKLYEFKGEDAGGYEGAGFGVAPKPDFWIGTGVPHKPGLHIAFRADSRAMVDAFYHAALAAGGVCNGAPGLRPHYHPDYYGAFVLDPDGHNIEAVCHSPE
ncbi:catechol 2,3-dioxygenase-like lactoylglutathione lyase family enzyme [Chitinivorax tropicus]|uniref:Catechol 2,3-dioxygenase-like lactoylglutathione lyase family enzyme n=1 Tax=Chitinivorax tropicus TaxID=714531 RepID=A0A840MWQ5_9PROT|nr:VOC family protein [Chitinivorax tropicus]MBB5019601.1 catechol 2,3-dioxygenase-like lactoylglutathione lyase family enzyme [Chitinivorax tropicus]